MTTGELRVHGVSGTPPRDILFTDPVREDRAPDDQLNYADVFVKPDRDRGFDVRAFHWGGLTAGSRWTAWWILLGPFALANAAGWMSRRHSKWGRTGVRVAGLLLTALFVDQLATAAVHIPDRKLLELGVSWRRVGLVALALLAVVLLLILVVQFSLRSHTRNLRLGGRFRLMFGPTPSAMIRPDAQERWDDPAAHHSVLEDQMWAVQPMLERLTRIHLGTGLATLALDLTTWSGAVSWLPWLSVSTLVAAVATMVLVGLVPEHATARWAATLMPHAGAVAVIAAVGGIAFGDIAADGVSIHSVTLGLALGLAAATLWAGLTCGLRVMGALVLSIQFGAVLGIVAGLVGEGLLSLEGELIERGAGWVSVAMVFLLATLVASVLYLMVTGTTDPPGAGGPPVPVSSVGEAGWQHGWARAQFLLRRAEQRAGRLLSVAAVYGSGVAGLVIYRLVEHRIETGDWALDPAFLGTPGDSVLIARIGSAVGVLLLAGMIGFVGVAWGRIAAAGAALGAAVVVAAAGAGVFSVNFLGVEASTDGGIVELAVFLAVAVPGFFLLRSVLSGLRPGQQSHDRRRKVGVLWDLTTFWPRWYQPLGPPAYGPKVVGALAARLMTRPVDVLAAHSQGSLIAGIVLARIEPKYHPRAYLSHGSQLGVLYPDIFPDVDLTELRRRLALAMPGRWLNLWRRTDPVGGHIVPELGADNLEVETGIGHSGYELTPEYDAARVQGLGVPRVSIDARSGVDAPT